MRENIVFFHGELEKRVRPSKNIELNCCPVLLVSLIKTMRMIQVRFSNILKFHLTGSLYLTLLFSETITC